MDNTTNFPVVVNCTRSCWVSSSYECVMVVYPDYDNYEQEECLCLDGEHTTFPMHDPHSCVFPVNGIHTFAYVFLSISAFMVFLLAVLYRRSRNSPQTRFIMLCYLAHVLFKSAVVISVLLQNGFYEPAAVLWWFTAVMVHQIFLALYDLLLILVLRSVWERRKYSRTGRLCNRASLVVQLVPLVLLVVFCRQPQYHHVYNILILMDMVVLLVSLGTLLWALAWQVQQVLNKLPPKKNNNRAVAQLRAALVYFRRLTGVMVFTLLLPVPWLVTYGILGAAPYYFLVAEFSWVSSMVQTMALVWWAVRFFARENRVVIPPNGQSSDHQRSSLKSSVRECEPGGGGGGGGGQPRSVGFTDTVMLMGNAGMVKLLRVGDGVPLIPIRQASNPTASNIPVQPPLMNQAVVVVGQDGVMPSPDDTTMFEDEGGLTLI